jgi:L-lactate dehydrogenase complex protein LldG
MKWTNRKPRDNQAARSAILERLKKAAPAGIEPEYNRESPSLYASSESALSDAFRENAANVNARVTIVRHKEELKAVLESLVSEKGWKEIICPEKHIRELLNNSGFQPECRESLTEKCDAAITGCEFLAADLGSVIVSSAQAGSRRIFVYPPVHIVIAQSSQLVETLEEGYMKTLGKFGDRLPSMITIITGPSRTADIEKTLVLGAHGPKELYIFILEEDFA